MPSPVRSLPSPAPAGMLRDLARLAAEAVAVGLFVSFVLATAALIVATASRPAAPATADGQSADTVALALAAAPPAAFHGET